MRSIILIENQICLEVFDCQINQIHLYFIDGFEYQSIGIFQTEAQVAKHIIRPTYTIFDSEFQRFCYIHIISGRSPTSGMYSLGKKLI